MTKFDEVNVSELISEIELALLKNLTSSLSSGDWRSNRARAFKSFQLRNRELINPRQIDEALKAELAKTYKSAGYATKRELEKMVRREDRTAAHFGSPRFSVDDKRMNALVKELQGNMRKVTTAARRQTEDVYRKSLAKTQTMLASNLYTLNECVDTATKDFLASGINCVKYADGRLVNINSYAEMALRTGNRRVTLQAEGAMRAEFGVFTVLISQYGACSDTCLPYQGKVYFDDVYAGGSPKGNTGGYPLLSTAIAGGLFHPNCRHVSSTWYPEINSIPPAMDEEKVKENAALEAKQRYNERQIRKFKRLEEGSVTPENKAKYAGKVKAWQAKQRGHINANPDVLRRDYHREKVFNTPTNLPNNDIMDSKGYKKIPITDEAIENIKLPVAKTLSAEQQDRLGEYSQQVLRIAKQEPLGTECAITASYPDMGYLNTYYGEKNRMSVRVPPEPLPYAMIHNHPSGMTFSPGDVRGFVQTDNMRVLVAVGNDGHGHVMEKLSGYNKKEFTYMVEILEKKYKSDPLRLMAELQKEAHNYGVNFFG